MEREFNSLAQIVDQLVANGSFTDKDEFFKAFLVYLKFRVKGTPGAILWDDGALVEVLKRRLEGRPHSHDSQYLHNIDKDPNVLNEVQSFITSRSSAPTV